MFHCSMFYLIVSVVLTFSIDRDAHVAGSQLPRIRGVPISKNSLYNPDRDFACLDGSRIIRFDYVNDDYCDCGDGSDEPGTAACSNGLFFCQNVGHRAKYIPSSRVNDGYCDCCDASDEYNSDVKCIDDCHELGREARLNAEKLAELAREGNKIRMEMLQHGKRLKSENQAKLVKLRSDYEEAGLIKKEKEILKNQAEERENIALEKYKPAVTEAPPADIESAGEARITEALDYFKLLDSDESLTVTIAELKTRTTFDNDRNGEVSEEEALFFLGNKQEVNRDEFVDFAWPIMKPFVMREQGAFKPPVQEPEQEYEEEEDHKETIDDQVDSQDHTLDEDIETDGEEEAHETEDEEREKEPEEPQVQYDEETQILIDEATQARERYQEAEKSVLELQTEMRRVEEKIERDYGLEEEFSSLDGECYEYRDKEYIYSFCPFGKTSQRSLSGGSEVSLGHYQDWAGTETNKYSKMKYDRGLTCWNGPARNTLVNLSCDKENRLISVSEPSRCEYTMEFTTPALCNPNVDHRDNHDEL